MTSLFYELIVKTFAFSEEGMRDLGGFLLNVYKHRDICTFECW